MRTVIGVLLGLVLMTGTSYATEVNHHHSHAAVVHQNHKDVKKNDAVVPGTTPTEEHATKPVEKKQEPKKHPIKDWFKKHFS